MERPAGMASEDHSLLPVTKAKVDILEIERMDITRKEFFKLERN